jgi:hypothetical protein
MKAIPSETILAMLAEREKKATFREIATKFGLNLQTAYCRVTRAMKKRALEAHEIRTSEVVNGWTNCATVDCHRLVKAGKDLHCQDCRELAIRRANRPSEIKVIKAGFQLRQAGS